MIQVKIKTKIIFYTKMIKLKRVPVFMICTLSRLQLINFLQKNHKINVVAAQHLTQHKFRSLYYNENFIIPHIILYSLDRSVGLIEFDKFSKHN